VSLTSILLARFSDERGVYAAQPYPVSWIRNLLPPAAAELQHHYFRSVGSRIGNAMDDRIVPADLTRFIAGLGLRAVLVPDFQGCVCERHNQEVRQMRMLRIGRPGRQSHARN